MTASRTSRGLHAPCLGDGRGGASLSLGHFTTLPRGYMGSFNCPLDTLRIEIYRETLIEAYSEHGSYRTCDSARGFALGLIVFSQSLRAQ